ncbi:glycogen phosphorylase [Marchantia polymorpha subsp. ruderalis]|uniref:Alpha-1,4 glucan phosphorylase n=2 Tax=Marchantia polymorpha TaxID=3197 RepID=A0A176WM91_MARPO|nr:hypothetical protein AXG93_4145s1050 [Marchantia polymorpha subsp. ruderalis]PTQ32705.1 hypothetical protein MARPO_0096s0051 [Marchantia polymorpha]BBM97924.1 hypothetical protein Mp_1g09490 [Marchantia polymorpha subsp. ruderalis]|eukprot:PTQ32705.1 hypothetical protein MARPO_0096s0051 [Marchantia polymorpha]
MAAVGAHQPGVCSTTPITAVGSARPHKRNVAYKSNGFGRSLSDLRRSSLCLAICGNPTIQCVASEPRPKKAEAEKAIKPIANPAADDASSVASNIKYHAEYTPTFSPLKFDIQKAYAATAESVRDNLVLRWNETYKHLHKTNPKHIHYLSMEFLQGRALSNAVGNLEMRDAYGAALRKFGYEMEDVYEQEPDAALGNGGLGRLASCFLDSLATLNYPAWGYGLRYKYGLFHQKITKEGQEEVAEKWLELGHPWEIIRNDIVYPIRFGGKVVEGYDGKKQWVGGENIIAVAYDVPIPGYATKNTISLRLWQTKVHAEEFNLDAFNNGEHDRAASAHASAEKICYVLYPGDASVEGKILRLKQQYTLCSASVQDIIARFKERSELTGSRVNWDFFPSKVAIQMNDTHPTLSAPELMRILIDVEGLTWDQAWHITQASVAYTNHTVLPEALEKWPLDIFQKLLPRHFEIIEKIDNQFMKLLLTSKKFEPSEMIDKIHHMRILHNSDVSKELKALMPAAFAAVKPPVATKAAAEEEVDEAAEKHDASQPQTVRMANLCVIAGHTVNGVAAIHSEIVKDDVFNDFYRLWPNKFQNKTNGVTPRRWLRFCNPDLSAVITKWLGSEEWVLDTEQLAGLRKYADDKDLHREWFQAKRSCKIKLAAYIKEKTGYSISPDALYDIQVKRIHEYKRQLLNIMGVIHRYKKMKEMSPKERKAKYVPRVVMFGGKAFATYWQAKRIVKLITDVAATVNHDPEIGDMLKVIFVPDYNVSVAEVLIPASELSQHISTAGMEASGTSNMKFCMNGCVLIGTLDGANVEIREEVGEENFFLFGARADQINALRQERADGKFEADPQFEAVKKFIKSGVFGTYDFQPLLSSLEGNEGFGRGDYFLVGKDFPSYIKAQDKVDEAYKDMDRWTKMSIMNTAGSPKFSSDRTIHEYAKEIWGIDTYPVP